MSHVTKLEELPLNNLLAMQEAAQACGLEMQQQQTYRTYNGQQNPGAEYVLVVPGNRRAYEIGLVPSTTQPGTYTLAFDSYAGGMGTMSLVGNNCDLLLMHYQMQVARLAAEAQGDTIEFEKLADGSYKATSDTQVRLGV